MKHRGVVRVFQIGSGHCACRDARVTALGLVNAGSIGNVLEQLATDSWIGRSVDELPTPIAVVDLDRLEVNIARLAGYAREHGIALWPHAKTHKMPPVARMQLDAGAAGLTVAKAGEAEVFARHGLGPLLLHYPVYGADAWRRLVGVAGAMPLTVAVDSYEAAEPLAAALAAAGTSAEVLVEIDVGLHRTGVASAAAACTLAERIDRLAGLDLSGVSCYPGHVRGPGADIEEKLAAVEAILAEAVAQFARAGLRCDRVSGGCTPAMTMTHLTPSVNELRAGTYVFLDRTEVAYDGPLTLADCALRVHATVVSTAVPGNAVIDAGTKTLSDALYGGPGGEGRGAVIDHPDVTIRYTNEEHGVCDISRSQAQWQVGDRIEIVPNHVCTCVNLQDAICAARAGVVEHVWTVEARGKIR
jgi:D-serine deaminase-like pyridoxal phosphate-dependent protein